MEKPKVTGRKVWTIGTGEELSWCPSWSNSLVQGWSCTLVHCTGVTDLKSAGRISCRTPLKPQNSNPKPNSLANHVWYIDLLTPPTPLIIPHRLHAFLESLIPLKNWWSLHARCSKSSLKHSMRFCGIFPSLKQNFIAYRSSKVSDCIFKFISYDSQALVGCIPIPVVAVYLNVKS